MLPPVAVIVTVYFVCFGGLVQPIVVRHTRERITATRLKRELRRLNGNRRSANASPRPAFCQGSNREAFALALGAMVMVDVTAALDGVTVDGENVQVSPEGRPEQVKLTAWLNPFSGVTDSVIVVDWPELMVTLVGDDASVNEGLGILMVYAAVPTALFA